MHRWEHSGLISDSNEFQFVINKKSSKNIWWKTAGSGAVYEKGLTGERAAAADGCRRGLSKVVRAVFLCLWINSGEGVPRASLDGWF